MNLDELRAANTTRVLRWHPEEAEQWRGTDWGVAMGGECGEALNVVKKLRREETGARNDDDPTRAELIDMLGYELADTIIYADLLAHHYGIDLSDAIRTKFNATSERYGFPERLT